MSEKKVHLEVEDVPAPRSRHSSETKALEKSNFLGSAPLIKTMWMLTYPDLIEKFTEAFYSIIDTMFIGSMAGDTEAERVSSLASISFSIPLVQGLVFGACLFISIGSGALYSQSLGKNNNHDAESIIWNMFLMCLVIGIVCPILYDSLSYYLLLLLGASPDTDVFHPAQLYFIIVSSGMIFDLFSVGCSSLIRGEGSALFSSGIMICGFIMNLICDPILIGVLKLNVIGAGISTMLGYAVSGLLGFIYFFTKKATVHVSFKKVHFSWSLMKPVMNIGISGLCSAFSIAIFNLATNRLILHYSPYDATDERTIAAIAAAGAVGRVNYFCFLPMLSISQAIMPILSYCKGAKLYKRHMDCMRNGFIASFSLGVILAILGYFLAPVLGRAMGDSEEFMNFFVPAMRYATSSVPLGAFALIMYPTLQSNGYGLMAAVLIACKQCIFYIVVQIIICEIRHDIWGCFMANPFADLCSSIFALIIFCIYRKKLSGGRHASMDETLCKPTTI